jgi:hypothetical protein
LTKSYFFRPTVQFSLTGLDILLALNTIVIAG